VQPRNGKRRPLTDQARGAAAKQAQQVDQTETSVTRGRGSLPAARALLLPATGRRNLHAAVVLRCPYCRRSHLHRGGSQLASSVRSSGCNPSREYILKVTPR
jgi:hypothetical protein